MPTARVRQAGAISGSDQPQPFVPSPVSSAEYEDGITSCNWLWRAAAAIASESQSPHRQAQRSDLVGCPLAIVALWGELHHPRLRLGEPRAGTGMIERCDAPVRYDLPPRHVNILHGAFGRMKDERAERVARRHHVGMIEIDQHNVGLRADRKAAEIVSHQG